MKLRVIKTNLTVTSSAGSAMSLFSSKTKKLKTLPSDNHTVPLRDNRCIGAEHETVKACELRRDLGLCITVTQRSHHTGITHAHTHTRTEKRAQKRDSAV